MYLSSGLVRNNRKARLGGLLYNKKRKKVTAEKI
jgi:hypothetical protein